MKTVLFTGGGTAGHIVPNLSLAEKLYKKGYNIHYIGSEHGMEKSMVKNHPYITYHSIPCIKLIRSLTLKNLKIPFVLYDSIKQSKKLLNQITPDVIFSKGGYVSLPVALACKNIPLIGHESDLSMGLSNKLIYQKCTKMCFTFQETAEKYPKKGVYTGSIIHPKFKGRNKKSVLENYNFTSNLPKLLVIGGSLGSKTINHVIQKNLNTLAKEFVIIHIVGRGKINNQATHENYIQLEFVDQIENYIDWANIVLTRGGSNAIHEILYCKKPMLIIPLSKKQSRGDQIDNAKNFENRKIAKVLFEEELNSKTLLFKLKELYKYAKSYKNNMEIDKTPIANDIIIKIIEELANNKKTISK